MPEKNAIIDATRYVLWTYGSFCQEQTFAVADPNDRVWSEPEAAPTRPNVRYPVFTGAKPPFRIVDDRAIGLGSGKFTSPDVPAIHANGLQTEFVVQTRASRIAIRFSRSNVSIIRRCLSKSPINASPSDGVRNPPLTEDRII